MWHHAQAWFWKFYLFSHFKSSTSHSIVQVYWRCHIHFYLQLTKKQKLPVARGNVHACYIVSIFQRNDYNKIRRSHCMWFRKVDIKLLYTGKKWTTSLSVQDFYKTLCHRKLNCNNRTAISIEDTTCYKG